MDKNIIEFEFVGKAIEEHENTITDLLKKWLVVENGLDVIVTSFVSEGYGTIIIDCVFDGQHRMKALQLSIQLFEKLHIEEYNIIE